jgi:sortase A
MTTMQIGRRLSGMLATVLLAFGLLAAARIASAFHGQLERAEKPVDVPAVPLGRFAEGDLVARVLLPRLGARFEILEGVESATLASGAGHVPGTSLPGETGGRRHALIAMPRDAAGAPLGALRLSDAIEMKTPFGTRRYVVVARSIHPAGEIPLASGSRERVTLVTPYPDNPIGPAPLRLAILAEAERGGGSPAVAPLASRRFSLWRASREWLAERSAAPLRSSQLLDELRDAIHRANL